ncbi:hypothetical protein JCM8208_006005 [Rhodotorula glutinis]
MATSARPSHVPLPVRDSATRPAPPADIPPTPSAFPALPATATHSDNGHDGHPHPQPAPAQPGISYAKVSQHLLPPSKAPQGTSLPPPPHQPQPPKLTSHNSKERLQPSQNGRDSPYARGTSPSSASSSNKHKHKAQRGSNAHAQKPAVNGKPVANWVPEKVGVHAPAVHSRAASSSGIPAPVSTSSTSTSASGSTTDPAMHTVGKKRRQSLRKVLPPTSSKLSPFAASFDFVPGGGPALGAPIKAQPQPDAHEPEPEHDSSSSAPASSGGASPADAGERELLTADEQRAIQQTVGSAGAQGDDFRKKGFTATDAEGAVESAGAEPGMQSAGADKSTSLSIAEDEVPRRRAEAASLDVDEPREDRPLGAFLDEAFVHASGAFAPLALPEQDDGDVPARTQPQVRPADELRIPGAVDASPVADLEWRDKKGWWSEEYDPLAAAPAAVDKDVEPEREQAHEPALAEPAIESAQAHDYEPILRFPAWSPAAAAGSSSADEGRVARDLVKDGEAPAPLSSFLGSAFVDSAAERLVTQDGAVVEDEKKQDGSSLLTAQELRDIASTVGSAGAQGDGFVKLGFTEADRQGAEEAAGNEAADQSAQGYKPSAVKQEEQDKAVEVAPEAEPEQPAPVEATAPTASSPSPPPAPPVDAPAVDAAPSSESPAAPDVADSPSSPAPTTPSALSSFLSSSFAAPLESGWTAFEPLDERRAEALHAAGPLSPSQVDPNDFPTSAEAVAAMPRLDDVLDVDIDAEGKVVPEGDEAQPPASSAPVVEEEKEEKRGWWNADEAASTPAHEQHADGSSLLSAAEQRDIASTVGSAGAQGDEFSKKGFAAADAEGAQVAEGADPAQQSAGVGATSVPGADEGAAAAGPSEDEVKAVEEAQARSSGTQTPLGSFLGQAFSGEPPSATEAPVASTSTAAEPAFSSFASTSTPAVSSPPPSAPVAQRSSSRSPSRSRSPSPLRLARRASGADDDDESAAPHKSADSAPSLTLAIASAWHTAPWTRKMWAVLASVAINVGLPFVNGVMLGFGELFARNFIGVRLGWPLGGSSSSSSSGARANTSGVGLRAAGGRRADVPGHAGAKTAVEAAGEAVREAAE